MALQYQVGCTLCTGLWLDFARLTVSTFTSRILRETTCLLKRPVTSLLGFSAQICSHEPFNMFGVVVECAVHKVLQTFALRSWFKGNDTRAVCTWLECKYSEVIARDPQPVQFNYLKTIWCALKAGNDFLRRAYRCHLFMRKREAKHLAEQGRQLLLAFMSAASQAFAMNACRFKITPKYHLFGHVVLWLERACERQAWILSPISFSCQIDEDIVGRVCKTSTTCGMKRLRESTIRKYLVNVRAHMMPRKT